MPDELGDVTLRVEGQVAVVTLERPAKLNALSRHMELELLAVLESETVRESGCVVLTGSGRAFSAGADLYDFTGLDTDATLANLSGSGRVYELFATLPQPTIAAISGYCIGGGLELAIGADLRLADDTAVFELPEVAYGIVTSGAAHRLVRLVGPSRAKELLLFRRRLSAEEAAAFGLVAAVVPRSALLERAIKLGEVACGNPPGAARAAKALIELVADAPHDVAVALEQATYAALSQTRASRAARRGDV